MADSRSDTFVRLSRWVFLYSGLAKKAIIRFGLNDVNGIFAISNRVFDQLHECRLLRESTNKKVRSLISTIIGAGKNGICAIYIALGIVASYCEHAHAAPECQYADIAALDVDVSRLSPAIEGKLNGTPSTLLIDTGSQLSQLTMPAAERLGLKRNVSHFTVAGVGGESTVYQALIDELSFGGLKWEHQPITVIGQVGDKTDYSMLIGAEFLFRTDLEMFLAKRTIRFFKPTGCDGAFLAYWNPDASDIPTETMLRGDHRQVVIVELNGQKMRAMIDSGAQVTTVNLSAAARAGVTPNSDGVTELGSTVGIGRRSVKTWLAPFKTFTIGNETISNPKISMMDVYAGAHEDSEKSRLVHWAETEPDMLLGADFLRAHRVLFAVSQHRLYFSYLGGNVFDLPRVATPTDKSEERP